MAALLAIFLLLVALSTCQTSSTEVFSTDLFDNDTASPTSSYVSNATTTPPKATTITIASTTRLLTSLNSIIPIQTPTSTKSDKTIGKKGPLLKATTPEFWTSTTFPTDPDFEKEYITPSSYAAKSQTPTSDSLVSSVANSEVSSPEASTATTSLLSGSSTDDIPLHDDSTTVDQSISNTTPAVNYDYSNDASRTTGVSLNGTSFRTKATATTPLFETSRAMGATETAESLNANSTGAPTSKSQTDKPLESSSSSRTDSEGSLLSEPSSTISGERTDGHSEISEVTSSTEPESLSNGTYNTVTTENSRNMDVGNSEIPTAGYSSTTERETLQNMSTVSSERSFLQERPTSTGSPVESTQATVMLQKTEIPLETNSSESTTTGVPEASTNILSPTTASEEMLREPSFSSSTTKLQALAYSSQIAKTTTIDLPPAVASSSSTTTTTTTTQLSVDQVKNSKSPSNRSTSTFEKTKYSSSFEAKTTTSLPTTRKLDDGTKILSETGTAFNNCTMLIVQQRQAANGTLYSWSEWTSTCTASEAASKRTFDETQRYRMSTMAYTKCSTDVNASGHSSISVNGSVIVHTCENGYLFSDGSPTHILECVDGRWNGNYSQPCFPNTGAICGPLSIDLSYSIQPAASQLGGGQQAGTLVVHTCQPGYVFPKGEPIRLYECLTTGLWSSNVVPSDKCSQSRSEL